MNVNNIKEWVLYDGACPMCSQFVHKGKKNQALKGFEFVPVQSEFGKEKTKHIEDPLKEMLLLTSSGELIGGAEALIYLAKRIWWAQPLYWIYFIPGMKTVYKYVYALVAQNRYCIRNVCKIK